MKVYQKLILSLWAITILSCQQNNPPQPFGATPSQAQLNWHEMEYFSLVCFGLNTYTEEEWAYGDVDPKLFNPSDLDTDQWAKIASEAGMKGLILVAKHHDGFCLWPSKYTNYSVKATPWKEGQGDILDDLSKSCKKYGLKLGVYLSPWDRNHAEYGQAEYVQFYYQQLEELLTGYGDIFEFWIDGANGGTGYYGGANENRSIDRETYYGFENIFSIVKKHQPGAVIFSDVGPGSRWVGNESGIGSETNWNTINTKGKFPGEPDPSYHKKLGTGEKNGTNWIPAEVNTTLLWPKAWYYHTGHQPRSLKNLMDLYYTSIGRGSPLNLGIAIAPTGKIREIDAQALLKFHKQVEKEFKGNLANGAKISASNYRNKATYHAKNIIDNSTDTYWATSDSIKKASLTLDFGKETTFNRLLLQEYIQLGQRVHKFSLEIETEQDWKEIASGTTIGYKRILRFKDTKTSKARITLETDAPCITLSNVEIYNAPPLLTEPKIKSDKNGNITINNTNELDIYYAVGEFPQETDFNKFGGSLNLPNGGIVFVYAVHKESGHKTEVVSKQIGITKSTWKIHSASSNADGQNPAINVIDGDPSTYWKTGNKKPANPPFISINLGKENIITGFSYLPLGLGSEGIIFEYEFYISDDGTNWGEPVSAGEFSNIENNPIAQVIKFNIPVNAKFVKLLSNSNVKNSPITTVAEIDIFK